MIYLIEDGTFMNCSNLLVDSIRGTGLYLYENIYNLTTYKNQL